MDLAAAATHVVALSMSWAEEISGTVTDGTQDPAPSSGASENLAFITDVIGPILGTGLVGALFLMVLFRIKIMPTYVYDQAKTAWDEERERLTSEVDDLKLGLKDATKVYTEQVIPTLTRVLDAERELVDLRRDEAAERRRRAPGKT